MSERRDLVIARARVAEARLAFREAYGEAAFRLSPAHLKQEASQAATHGIVEARDAVRRSARRHPVLIASVATGVAVFVFRAPIAALYRRTATVSGRIIDQIRTWKDKR